MDNIEYFDSHAHYDDERFNADLDEVLNKAYNMGVTKITNIGYSEQTSRFAISLANKYEYIYATVGLHPENIVNDNIEESLKFVNDLCKEKKVVAIGEIGLDYNWNKENIEFQKKYFVEQIKIANRNNLPIVIHDRLADMDVLDILKNVQKPQVPCIFHCFSSSVEVAKEVLRNDWYISLSGTVTFKNANNIHEVAKLVPLDKLLIETDCPYLSPEPFRGCRNDSSNVIYVAQKIAELRNMDVVEIARITYDNACKIYGIK